MANNYTQFSFEIDDITPDEKVWLEAEFERLEKSVDEIKALPKIEQAAYGKLDDQYFTGYGRGFELDFEGDHCAWFHDRGGEGDLEQLNEFLRRFIESQRPTYMITYGWADTCDKPRVDQFGGGRMLITKDGVECCSGGCLIEAYTKRRNKKKR